MKRDKLRIGVITAALAMMIAGGVLTWQQDARNGKADQAKQGETAQLTEDESTGTTEQQTEETAGDADGTRAVQDQADDVENSLEQVPEMEAACEEEAAGNPEADAETAQNTPEESDGNTERQDAQARGVILLAGYRQNVPIIPVTPLQVKQQMAGYGRATKKQVIEMVMRMMNITRKIDPDDAADALAIGLTAIYHVEHRSLFEREK